MGWSGEDLAERCGISLKTLRRYEPQKGIPIGSTKTLLRIEEVFKVHGIKFTGDPLVNPGVTLHISKDV